MAVRELIAYYINLVSTLCFLSTADIAYTMCEMCRECMPALAYHQTGQVSNDMPVSLQEEYYLEENVEKAIAIDEWERRCADNLHGG